MIGSANPTRRGHGLLMVMVVFNTLALLYFGAGLNRAESAIHQSYNEAMRSQARALAEAAVAAAQAGGSWDQPVALALEGAGEYRWAAGGPDNPGTYRAEGIVRNPVSGLQAHCVINLTIQAGESVPVITAIESHFTDSESADQPTD